MAPGDPRQLPQLQGWTTPAPTTRAVPSTLTTCTVSMPQLGWREPEVGPPRTRPCPLRPTPPCLQGPGRAGFRPSITGPHPLLLRRPHRPLRPQVGQRVTLRDLWPPDQHVGGKPLSQHSLLHLTEGFTSSSSNISLSSWEVTVMRKWVV